MIYDLPSTTTSALGRKLVDLRDSGGAIALGRVLTLIIVTEDAGAEAAIEAANDASREHPCRVLVVVQANRRGVDRLDAQIRIGGDAGASEVIVLRLYGKLSQHGDSVVTPLLLPDSPVVAWWPGAAPAAPSDDPIGAMAQRRITDTAAATTPRKELLRRRDNYADGDTDLAWTRITKWRGLLAAALDQPPFLPVESATVTGASDSASTDLLAAWLAESLRAPVVRARSAAGGGMTSVRLQRRTGPIDLVRVEGTVATLTQPGQPDRRLALPRRGIAECLAEELRRLDPDEIYHLALTKGLARLDSRPVSAAAAAAAGRSPSLDDARRRSRSAERREATTAKAIEQAAPDGEPGAGASDRGKGGGATGTKASTVKASTTTAKAFTAKASAAKAAGAKAPGAKASAAKAAGAKATGAKAAGTKAPNGKTPRAKASS